MIKIDKTFFCDHAENAQFNKVNFIGAVLTDEILISELPYNFISNLVLLGETDESIDIKIEIWNEAEPLYYFFYKKELDSKEKLALVEFFKIIIQVTRFGKIFFKIYDANNSFLLNTFEVLFSKGSSPNLNMWQHLPFSGILNDENDVLLIHQIIRTAKKSIKIIDTYLNNLGPLRKVLKDKHLKVEVLLLTDSKNKKSIESSLKDDDNFGITYMTPLQQRKFHDRFIIIDDCEYYHFGSSINGITSSKVSSFRKIVSLAEINDLKNKLEEVIGYS